MLAAAAAGCMLSWLPALPATAAATMVATVDDAQSIEYELACNPNVIGPCTVKYAKRFLFNLSVSNFSGPQITFGFQLENITATQGQDYVSWPYSPPNQITTGTDGKAQIAVDIVIDTIAEANETFRVRLTSASRSVDITDTGIGTILDGSQLPPDCTPSVVSTDTGSMTCGSRPAGQHWQARFQCGGFPPRFTGGTVVTGNGTSTATCVFDEPWLTGRVAFAIVA
jgi:hypothetical protein